MLQKNLILVFLFFISFAQAEPKYAIYADFGYLEEAFENGGVGMGAGYEMVVSEHLGVRARLGFIQRGLGGSNSILHLIVSALATYYPKSIGLEGFNVGLGAGFSNSMLTRNPQPFYQRIFPFIEMSVGYKILLTKNIVLEPSLIWMIVLGDPDLATTGIHQVVDTVGLTLGFAF